MKVDDEVIRAAFEKWAEREGYVSYEFDNAWQAFRAAFSIAIPDGWMVVPVEATRDMVTSGNDAMAWDCCSGDASDAWRAMVIDAPQPDYTK